MNTTEPDLKSHIDKINSGKQFKLISDPKYWNAKGIHTPNQFDRYMLICSIQELQKQINGFCKSEIMLQDLTTARLQDTLNHLKTKAKK